MQQMINSNNLRVIGLAILGFAVGWAASAFKNKPAIPGIEISKPGEVQNSKSFAASDSDEPFQQDVDNEVVQQSIQISAEDQLLELIYSESADHQLTATRVIDYFKLLAKDPERNPRRNKRLRDLLRNVPELSFALLDRLDGIEDQHVRSQLGISLMINNSMQRPFLEPRLIEKIKQHENRSGMLKLLGNWGLQSKSNLQYLHDELSFFEDPRDQGSAIRAISGSSWVQRSALEPELMQVEQYRRSSDSEVRAAAVAAMRTIVPTDYRQKLLESLEDSAESVRNEAMLLYINQPFESSELENKIFEHLQDPSLDYKERSQIAFSLERLPLSAEQKKLVKQVQAELDEQAKSLRVDE